MVIKYEKINSGELTYGSFITKKLVSLGFLSDTNDCYPNPCVNNGTCIDRVHGYNCTCVPGFKGRNCSISKFCYDVILIPIRLKCSVFKLK